MVLAANTARKSRPGASWGVLALFLASFAMAQEQGAYNSACFRGLVDADSPAVLSPCDAQDALNVESNLTGTAILKRKGYQAVASLTVSTGPVTGSHSFIDSSGNRQDIVCHDRYCAKSTNGNAFSNFLSTAGGSGSVPLWWSWVDSGGTAYGANSRRDPILSYDGTTLSYPAGMPQGGVLEMTQDRMVVGDIQSQPNRVHYSSAGAVTQFTVGVNNYDSFFDDIGSSGDRVRCIKCSNGLCYIFKSASITGCELGDQYTTRCAVMSTNLGTTDCGSVVAAGSSIYFRAQDKNYWEISGNSLSQISSKIPNLVKSQSGGSSGGEQSNTQTSQSDWQAGTQGPSGSWNTTTINGSVFPSSVTVSTTGTGHFNGAAPSGMASYTSGSVIFSSAAHLIYNGDFETGSILYWTCTGTTCGINSTTPIEGSYSGSVRTLGCSGGICGDTYTKYVRILDASNNVLATEDYSGNTNNIPASLTISLGAISTQTLKIQFYVYNAVGGAASLTSSTFTAISTITMRMTGEVCSGSTCNFGFLAVDAIRVNRYFSLNQSSATPVLSYRTYDTGFSAPVGGAFALSVSSPVSTGLAMSVRSGPTDSGAWTAWVSLSPGDRIAQSSEFYQFVSTFTTSCGTCTPQLNTVGFTAATTGYLYTQCIQPNSSISGWGTLSCAETKTGAGSLVYYATSAATCADLPATDPSTWQTTLTNNATVTIDTNTAVAVGFRSLLGSATDQAQVDSCILNWTEGAATQQAWGVYDSIKNAVYWTTTINNATSANRLLKYDRNLESWYPFDIAAQAPRVINNSLYFGGSSAGTWNLYGGVDADAGSAINAYWKSKDIGSDAPFQEKSFDRLSILSRNNGTGDMTATYTYSNAETGNYTISLSTGSGIVYARSNFYLPVTSPQVFVNVQVGNNSSTPFEVLGMGLTWSILPWAVNP